VRIFSTFTVFLNTVDDERSVSNYQKEQKIFGQGDIADSVFYVKEGHVKRVRFKAMRGRSGPD
jgi:CRP-like cAMP-binding protein